jgi:hypothetical protein
VFCLLYPKLKTPRNPPVQNSRRYCASADPSLTEQVYPPFYFNYSPVSNLSARNHAQSSKGPTRQHFSPSPPAPSPRPANPGQPSPNLTIRPPPPPAPNPLLHPLLHPSHQRSMPFIVLGPADCAPLRTKRTFLPQDQRLLVRHPTARDLSIEIPPRHTSSLVA